MAHFVEIDLNNIVLRVVRACDNDIANNGGEQSEQAAEHFKTICPLSINGVKWIQTSYNNNFRKKYARIGDTFDSTKNKFISPQPFASWSLDSNDDWKAPVPMPFLTKEEKLEGKAYIWNENTLSWDINN
jgi:CRISPR/Cas system CMR subunit Cmr6 (Cas7 group RAMP superfamily)